MYAVVEGRGYVETARRNFIKRIASREAHRKNRSANGRGRLPVILVNAMGAVAGLRGGFFRGRSGLVCNITHKQYRI